MSLKCKNCNAACCRSISNIIPNFALEDGSCMYLVNNKCSVYNKRPIICNVDKLYNLYYSNQYTIKEFYDIQNSCCDILRQKTGGPTMKYLSDAKKIKEVKYKGILYQERECILWTNKQWKQHKNNVICTVYFFKNNNPMYLTYKAHNKTKLKSFNAIKEIVRRTINA